MKKDHIINAIVVVIILCPLVFCGGPILLFSHLDEVIRWCRQFHDTMADLDAGNNRHIIITKESCGEMGTARFYQVKINDNIISPEYRYDYLSSSDDKFSLIYAEDKSLVGVLDSREPMFPVIIIYDFKTNQSYRATPDEYPYSIYRDLWQRLKKENPEINVPSDYQPICFPRTDCNADNP